MSRQTMLGGRPFGGGVREKSTSPETNRFAAATEANQTAEMGPKRGPYTGTAIMYVDDLG